MGISRRLIVEQGIGSISEYRRRVYGLAATYLVIFVTAIATMVLIVSHGEYFVTLAQRSNVETLITAFIIVLFGYLALVSLPGAWGAIKIVALNLPIWMRLDPISGERRKQAALRSARRPPRSVYLNAIVRSGDDTSPITIHLVDEAGSLGEVVIDGAKITHNETVHAGSNSLLAYFSTRIQQLLMQRGSDAVIEVVQWTTIDDEQALQYGSLVEFSRNLERTLGSGPLWPTVELSEKEIGALEQEASALCPIIRDEAHLPDLEYQVEHRVPIIPEPLGFIALSRSERRADPLASMGCAAIVMLVILAIVVLIILVPPWVPSK